jgi:hypothetical protein
MSSHQCEFNFQNLLNEQTIDEIVDSFFSTNRFQCGADDHETTRHPLCPLNSSTQAKQTQSSNKNCKCGSSTHLRTSYKNCRLNKRFIDNTQANQIQSIDDLNDVILTETNIINNNQVDECAPVYIQ